MHRGRYLGVALPQPCEIFRARFIQIVSIFLPFFCRSAPKGRQQMGETGFCKNLRFSAVSCGDLWFPAVFCANLRLPNPLIYRASRKSAKICKNLRKFAFRVRFLPFAVSLLARPDFGDFNQFSPSMSHF